MGIMANYFWDSYAIIELLHGSPNYAKYVQEPIIITLLNLLEIYWFAIHEYTEEDASRIYEKYRQAIAEPDDETLKSAIQLRNKYKRRNLSYADCIGYTYAVKNNLKFLTGDKEFEDMENVEFVK